MNIRATLAANFRRRKPRRASGAAALSAAMLAGATVLGGAAIASADPAVQSQAEPPPVQPGPIPVPSAPPVSAATTDGWTLALSANSETLTPAPPLNPEVPSRDFIVSGLFNGTLRNASGGTSPTPSGTLEAGYQVQCVGGGMMAMMKPAVVNVEVVKEEFTGADPSVAINDYRIQTDCAGDTFIRPYAILTRTTSAADSVVAYYGISHPV
ncbi:MspA family porin [Mycolicibacterium thermoresistibile]